VDEGRILAGVRIKGTSLKRGKASTLQSNWRFGVGVERDSFFISGPKPSPITAGADF